MERERKKEIKRVFSGSKFYFRSSQRIGFKNMPSHRVMTVTYLSAVPC